MGQMTLLFRGRTGLYFTQEVHAKGVSTMETNPAHQRLPSHYSLILVSLLTLIGILGGCGASSTAGPSHPTGSTPTSTHTQELKGTISEFPLPTPHFYPVGIMTGPDGNLWFTEAACAKGQSGKIGRITPAGRSASSLCYPTAILTTSPRVRIMLSGLPNMASTTRTARLGVSPPQV